MRFFIFIIFLYINVSVCQNNNLIYRYCSVEDGLSHPWINCMIQDHQSYMWFGTANGLNKYDGYDYKIFRHNPADSASISNDWILCMIEDSDRNIWVGTMYGLNRYNPETIKFTNFLPNPGGNLNTT